MNFKQALDEISKGKKVRACCWMKGAYVTKNIYGEIRDQYGSLCDCVKWKTVQGSWEIYEFTMGWSDALKVLQAGGYVTKETWGGIYLFCMNGAFYSRSNSVNKPYSLTLSDMICCNWKKA